MENKIKEVVQYCAANIVDWDLKSELAVRMIGRNMPIDYGFRNEIEECVEEWCEENEVSLDFFEDWDEIAEEIVLLIRWAIQ